MFKSVDGGANWRKVLGDGLGNTALDDQYTGVERDRIVQGLHRHDVGSAAYFPAVHVQPHFQELGYRQGDFPITESVAERTLALPFYTRLSARDADFAASTFELMIARENLSRRDT